MEANQQENLLRLAVLSSECKIAGQNNPIVMATRLGDRHNAKCPRCRVAGPVGKKTKRLVFEEPGTLRAEPAA